MIERGKSLFGWGNGGGRAGTYTMIGAILFTQSLNLSSRIDYNNQSLLSLVYRREYSPFSCLNYVSAMFFCSFTLKSYLSQLCMSQIIYIYLLDMLNWLAICSITLVSTTILMTVGAYLAILPQASSYFSITRTKLLIFSSCFNIAYVIIGPFIMRLPQRTMIRLSCIVICICSLGRWLAGNNYTLALTMTLGIAVAHVAIINAPYAFLHLFPPHHRAYASSVALVMPTLGINVCIFYGMTYVVGQPNAYPNIEWLNGVIAIIGMGSTALTLALMHMLERQFDVKRVDEVTNEERAQSQSYELGKNHQQGESERDVIRVQDESKKGICTFDLVRIVSWGSIVGISWSYGALFGVLFSAQNLSEKEIALVGLFANLSSIVFSNLGSYLLNKSSIKAKTLIQIMIGIGILSAFLIFFLEYITLTAEVRTIVLCILIITLRAGYSSFVPLSFIQMQRFNPLENNSGKFFWVANISNLLLMLLIDLIPVTVGIGVLGVGALLCFFCSEETYSVEYSQ